jgi:hypothetical protein
VFLILHLRQAPNRYRIIFQSDNYRIIFRYQLFWGYPQAVGLCTASPRPRSSGCGLSVSIPYPFKRYDNIIRIGFCLSIIFCCYNNITRIGFLFLDIFFIMMSLLLCRIYYDVAPLELTKHLAFFQL